ncbi:MAG: NYN domain-containing protein [Saprospiraceae bacterium]|nr:NYN domain-containing protein [Saprospiraceae bacterium]
MQRVITYIDGFNLYFGMKAQYRNQFLWLDVEALSRSFLLAGQTLAATKYFTSRVANQPEKEKRQGTYLEALKAATGCHFFYGRYQSNVIECKGCGSNWPSPKEKMTDVNIATQMLLDAFTDKFDTAIIISGDTDLIPPILAIKSEMPQKQIGVYFPPKRHSIHLEKLVDFSGLIGKKKLRDSQLPDNIKKPGGYILNRPDSWV